MEMVLKHRAEIYGFLALWIMVFHLDSVGIPLPDIPLLTNFIRIGNAGVDVFFFLSGYCLYLSLSRNSNVGYFFRKRFKRVVLVYLVVAIPFFIYKMAFETRTNVVLNFFFDLSGLSFWYRHCLNVWFVHAIIVFYLFTIPFFHIIRKGVGYSIALLLFLYLLNFIGHFYIPLYNDAAIAYSRLPAYVCGMFLADIYSRYHINEQSSRYKKFIKYASIILVIYLIVFLFTDMRMIILDKFGSMYLWLSFITIIFPVLSLCLILFKAICTNKGVSSFLKKIGALSLEVYMIHILILHIFNFQGWQSHLGYWSWLIVPLLTFPLSIAANKLAEKISMRIFSPN